MLSSNIAYVIDSQNKANALANKMKDKDYLAFWKDIKSQQKCTITQFRRWGSGD